MPRIQNTLLSVLCLLTPILTNGCHGIPDTYHGRDLLLEEQGTWNPAALSGGKITDYTPLPDLPREPTAKEYLEACRFYNFPAYVARSAIIEFKTPERDRPNSQVWERTNEIVALVVGGVVLVDPGDVMRQGFYTGISNTQIYHNGPDRMGQWAAFGSDTTPSPIVFTAGSKWATVGTQRVLLQYPPQRVDIDQAVLEWTDWLRLNKVRDAQRGQSATPSIGAWRILYRTSPIERGEPWHTAS